MFVPLVSAILAIIISVTSFYLLKGEFSFISDNLSKVVKKNKLIFIGLNLIAFALFLGLVGYWLKLGGNFRYIRLLIIIVGLIYVKIPLAKNINLFPNINPFFKRIITINNSQALQVFAGIIVSFLALKSIVAVDWPNGDSWMYQLPFAARFWGMVSPQEYVFEVEREPFYNTSTMLPNILQGFFWRLFGLERPQGANLVSFFSFIGYLIFVKHYLKIPYYLSSLALLAVPLFHIAVTSAYVDLFTNIGFSITIIITYLLFIKEDFIKAKNVIIFIIGGFIAANSKYLLVPPLFLLILVVLGRILWLIFYRFNPVNKVKNTVKLLIISFTSGLLIFATEVKNLWFYQNPFYPLKVSLFGYELNHTVVPSSTYMADAIASMSPIQRWIFSLLEIGAFDERRPWPWTIAMDYVPLEADSFGMGGYFAFYVIFNVVLFAFLCKKKNPETRTALIFIIVLSLITPFMPFSYQLRYYMYWIIILISLNLYLLINHYSFTKNKWLKPENYGYVAAMVLMIFAILTRWDFTYPNAMSLEKFMSSRVDQEIIADIEENEEVCLVGFTPLTFLYSSSFHEGRNYSVKAEFNLSEEEVREKCDSRRIIRKN